jgi:hypothetical protein
MTTPSADPGEDGFAYTYRPSLQGSPWAYHLTADGLAWRTGNKSGLVAYRDIRRLRMTYRPVNMQSYRFMTEIWADGASKFKIVSSSWKSIFEQERLDAHYSAFIAELHRRLVQAGATPRYEQGSHWLIYWPGVIVFTAMLLGLSMLTLRAVQADALGAAAFIAAFCAFFMWQGGNFLRRNWPNVYSPNALPAMLLP